MLLLAFASTLSSCDSWLETCLLSVDACAALPASCGSCATCVAAKPAAKPAAAKPAPTPAAEVAARHPAERKDKKSVASRVQHWWATGRPATNISDAGTLVRVFDALTPPKGQPKGVLPWEPCVDRASPTLFRALRAVLTATTVSGIFNVNYKVRADGTPALLEMNTGRPTGDLVAAPAAVVAKFLLEYARRAGACPPGSAFERAEEDAVVSAAERSVFTTEAAAAKRGGYSESLFDDFVRI